MTTTIDLADDELAELRDLTQESDPAAAARAAVHEYLRYARRMRLIELSDVVEMDDNWQELEALELNAQHGQASEGSH